MKSIFLITILFVFSVGAQEPSAPEEIPCDSSCYYYPDLMQCVSGECRCTNPAYIHFPTFYECALPVGSECSADGTSKCPSIAPCRNPYDSGNYQTGLICSNGLSGTCSSEADCNPGNFLACVSGYCKCNNPLNHAERNGRCLVKTMSSGCSSDGIDKPKCQDQNAECDATDETCKCKDGYVFYQDQCIRKPIGQRCKYQYDCSGGLDCKNRVCRCTDDNMVYNMEQGLCQIKLGDRCDTSDITNYWHPNLCHTPNSTCQIDKKKVKRCMCRSGFVASQETDEETGVTETLCVEA